MKSTMRARLEEVKDPLCYHAIPMHSCSFNDHEEKKEGYFLDFDYDAECLLTKKKKYNMILLIALTFSVAMITNVVIEHYKLEGRYHEKLLLHSVTTPTAIHLALSNDPSEMVVNFVTGTVKGTPVAVYSEASTVTEPNKNSAEQKATGTTDSYQASDMCQAPANVEEPGKFQPPGSLHTVTMTGLVPGTTYQYKVGLEFGQGITWSEQFCFTAAPVEGSDQPFSYLVYGSQGCPETGWTDGAEVVSAMAAREVEIMSKGTYAISQLHHLGDLSYAEGAAHIWDAWFEMIQPITTRVPLMISIGNHEYDHETGGGNGKDPSGVSDEHGYMPVWGDFSNDSHGECGVPASKRFTMPQSSGSNGVFWYSYNYANVHTTVISSEHDLSPGSIQHEWLERDLSSVNRTAQPWLIVETHRPLYEGEALWKENAVGIGMRYAIEDLLVDYKVDLVLAGHYRAYHRTCDGLFHSKCNNKKGGPMHITIGTAGARLDDASLFTNPWTARYIKHEYGYGRITVANASALHFEFVKAGDVNDTSAGEVHDSIWIYRDR